MKIALLCDGFIIKDWQAKLIRDIISEIKVERFYIINQQVVLDKSSRLSGEKNALWKLYQKIDSKIYDRKGYFKSLDVRNFLHKYEVLSLKSERVGLRDYVESCKQLNIDIAIRLGWRIIDGDILSSFKNGILSLHHGDNRVNRGGPWCFWEVFLNQSLTGVTLQVLNRELDAGGVLERGFFKTDFTSITKNRIGAIDVGNSLLLKNLKMLSQNGSLEFLSEDRFCYDNPIYKTPSAFNLSMFIIRILKFALKRKINSILFNEHWGIAYKKRNSEVISLSGLMLMPNNKKSFIADPFLINDGDNHYIFYERYCYLKRKGIIACFDIMNQTWKDVLEEEYHLSFPFVFRTVDRYYMIPQSENHSVDLYEATNFPFEWKKINTLLSSSVKHYSDAVLWFMDGVFFIIVNEYEKNIDSSRYMNIYHAESLFGEFEAHSKNPVKINDSETRNAGAIHNLSGDLFRIAQNCQSSYGQSMKVMKIEKLTKNDYKEIEIDTINPNFMPGIAGTHTLNFNDYYIVTDFKTRRLKMACKI